MPGAVALDVPREIARAPWGAFARGELARGTNAVPGTRDLRARLLGAAARPLPRDDRRPRAALDAVAAHGACDLTAITDDFPLLNLADLLAMPASDRHLLLTWTNRVIGYQDPDHGERCATGAGDRSTRARRPHSPTCSPTPTSWPPPRAAAPPTT